MHLLRSAELRGIHFHEGVHDPLQARPDLLEHWRALATQPDPADALARAFRLRLLTALREGPQGVRGLNARIEARLSGRRLDSPPAWFPGRLLLVTEISYRHGLFNGDVGLCLPDADGTPLAWFPGGSEGLRAFHPAALPAHESAFAMTVHKAQGSEFDEVWLQLPQADARVLSRELIYTGLTRARSALHVAETEEAIVVAACGPGVRVGVAIGSAPAARLKMDRQRMQGACASRTRTPRRRELRGGVIAFYHRMAKRPTASGVCVSIAAM